MMSTLFHDFRYGFRMLAKNPGFTTVAVLSLALGIGANTIIFSQINKLFLHPSGISDPEHLFAVRVKYDKLNLKSIVISAPDFKDIQDSKQVFASAAASNEESFNYLAPEGPQRLTVAKVTWQWFDAFGARPFLGRTFRPEEDQPRANQVALARLRHLAASLRRRSCDCWQEHSIESRGLPCGRGYGAGVRLASPGRALDPAGPGRKRVFA